jgi:hypothetical protein
MEAVAYGCVPRDVLYRHVGIVLVLHKRSKQRIPALVTIEVGVVIRFIIELFIHWGII